MSNYIFDINDKFNYDLINLGNPTIINNNAYFSKISHGDLQKNLYLQFPKCNSKAGIIKSNNKMMCELNYFMTNKHIIEFFENLEKKIIDKVYNNKELWFYESENIEKNDIEELMTSIIKPFKHGRNFLVKTYINYDKFNIYNENEIKVDINNLTCDSEFIPLININGIKFTSKSFLIELILAQAMVIVPADEFEKNILIKCNNYSPIINNNESTKKEIKPNDISLHDLQKNVLIDTETIDAKTIDAETIDAETIDAKTIDAETIDAETRDAETRDAKVSNDEVLDDNDASDDPSDDDLSDDDASDDDISDNEVSDDVITDYEVSDTNVSNNEINNEESKKNEMLKETKLDLDKNLVNLEKIDIDLDSEKDNLNADTIMKLKSQKEIHLEIYKTAHEKAKKIRKEAINAFLDAKNIKIKYDLNDIINSDSSDDEDFINS